jgi:hypothetical protein
VRGRRRTVGIMAVTASVALGLAGCGGTSTSGHVAAARTSAPALHLYRVILSGRAERRGAPHGVGMAIIAIHKGSVICWRFAHLHGFVNATVAHIHAGRGSSGAALVSLSNGPRLHHQGCTRAAAAAVSAIVRDPGAHYVNVDSAAYPTGAVRGQL